ncbi:MAG: hypothetical protein JWO38_787 [Gemmataceae bacterium]|nr:hypothetical protein [Gemmataceae bacterium]
MAANLAADSNRPAADLAQTKLAQLADRPDVPLPEVLRRVCEAAAEALRVERTGVWLFVNGEKALRCVSLFERSKGRHSKGACLLLTDFPAFQQAISSAPLLPCEAARSDPRTAELFDSYLAPLGIASVLDAPVLRDGRVVGLVCHEHVGPPRDWTDNDRTFALAVADIVAGRMKAAEGILRTAPRPQPPPVQPHPGPPRPHEVGRSGHDLCNVLAEILSHTELVAITPQLPPGVAARLDRITAAAERAVALVRGLCDPAPGDDPGTGEHETLPPADPAGQSPPTDNDATGEHKSLPPA